MPRRNLQSHRLVALFLFGCAVFNYPFLAVFDRAERIAGLPAIVVWLFVIWLTLIALMAWVVEGTQRREH